MAEFDFYGNIIESDIVDVASLRAKYPTYNDDQLLAEAITLAKLSGGSTKILWDGSDIHFSGQVEHELKGFGGVDFNGVSIFMPDYDNGTILKIVPESSEDIEVQASDIHETHVTEQKLKGKVFTLNNTLDGNADMCLGDRPGFEQSIYYSPCLMAMPDGNYTTDRLYLTPTSGTVTAYNVHYQPKTQFEICNANIIASTTVNMSVFIYCTRSTTHIHGFKLVNRSNVDKYRRGVIIVEKCYGVEIDHIIGVNPSPDTAGNYAIGLMSVTRAYIHDIDIGDTNSWGVIGARHYTDVTFERCFMKRWDCHFAQYGYNYVKDCTIRSLSYGKGFGKIVVDGCTFIQYRDEEAIALRSDSPGVFDGDIIVKDSVFKYLDGIVPSGAYSLWYDCHYGAKAQNDVTDRTPHATRILDNCIVQAGHKSIFKIGAGQNADTHEFENLTYIVKNMVPTCASVIFESMSSTGIQSTKKVKLDNCEIQSDVYVCNTLQDCDIVVDDCDFGANAIKLKKNNRNVKVSNTKMASVTAEQASNNLTMTGCTISGTQSVGNFTAYALAGNIASDMESVNKHS